MVNNRFGFLSQNGVFGFKYINAYGKNGGTDVDIINAENKYITILSITNIDDNNIIMKTFTRVGVKVGDVIEDNDGQPEQMQKDYNIPVLKMIQ